MFKTLKIPVKYASFGFDHLNFEDLVIVSNFDIRISDFPVLDPISSSG